MAWEASHRAELRARLIADRHYNRQKIGSPQFVPPGRCVVFFSADPPAVFVSSWPFAKYVKHAWAGAWVNTLFRKEGLGCASEMIREAIALTRSHWPAVPQLGMITFVDPRKVPPVKRHGKEIFGYCYLKAGFKHVGFTKDGKWAWQILPAAMPRARR